ncbi:uncharacterized protein LOC133915485 [Phragmites australis]|uniref:uncharacterized protein LOC133915485 n=1 Tax=Phragmites australis TaxID=29695 RepID=UPI002D7A053C|nr:uncharacterized protein LOC133915485 [Phragmites australis]
MAGASGSSRLLRTTTKAFQTDSRLPSSSTSGNASPYRIPSLKFPFLWEAKKTHRISRAAEQRAALITLGAASITPEKRQGIFLSEEVKNIDLLLPLAYEITRRLILRQFGATWLALNRQCWSKIAETIIHQVIVSCQSFTLIGIAGSLVGSVPCFAEGCVVVVKSFFMCFCAMSHTVVDRGEIIKLLIEALDMFLIGTALLTFGMGMYIMFYGSQSIQKPGQHIDTSHLGAFNLKKLKEGARIRSITQAKTRIGHAILLLLQVGVLEKFKSVPLASGLDMACFAGAVLASSAGVFLLSKLTVRQQECKQAFV